MKVYLVRHAIAVPRGAPGVFDDRLRELTPLGIKKMRRGAGALAASGMQINEIWSSPLVRAKQTAELLAEAFGLSERIRIVRALEPGGDCHQLHEKLRTSAGRGAIALVGHEPDLGKLATSLLSGPGRSIISFKKGGVACIEVDDFSPPIQGELVWMLTPKQMKLMR